MRVPQPCLGVSVSPEITIAVPNSSILPEGPVPAKDEAAEVINGRNMAF